jgi:hypothetical protein
VLGLVSETESGDNESGMETKRLRQNYGEYKPAYGPKGYEI